jgi:hypothetical protein
MGGFFSFEKLISADFIRALYYVGAGLITMGGIFVILGIGGGFDIPIPVNMKIQGVIVLIVGNLIWRILCEGWILFFRMYETLLEIQANTKR